MDLKSLEQRYRDVAKAARENLTARGENWKEKDDAFITQLADIRADIDRVKRLHAIEDALPDEPIRSAPLIPEEEALAGRVHVSAPLAVQDPKKGFAKHTDFLQAVMDYGRGRKMDLRLTPLKAAVGSDEAGEYSGPHGGFLVPEGFSPTLLQLQPEDDPISGRTRAFPMSNPVVSIPARVDKNHTSSVSGGLTVTRRPETVAATSSRMEFEKVTLRATSLFGLSYATEEIMTDSPISFITLISAGFSQQFGYHLTDERLNGTGVGEFEGINVSPALVSVAKETGQAADTINYDNIKKMRARCWGYQNAIWMANHDCMPQLMSLQQAVGTGGSVVYQPSAREDRPDVLFGRPIFYTEYCEKVGDAGDILLVNWGEYLEATYQPLQSAESMHVRFVEHERAFKFWLRNDGRGWWRSALTPKKSSDTLSPFVRLQARA